MGSKFIVKSDHALKWPNKCVTCGATATTTYKAYGSAFAGLSFKMFYHRIRYWKGHISYPTCLKHKYTTMMIRLLMFISFTAMIIMGIYIFLLLVLPESEISDIPPIEYFIFLFLISFVIFIASIKWQPLRLKDVGPYFITIVIRNEQYAREFSLLNKL